jgi:hypothetical protein
MFCPNKLMQRGLRRLTIGASRVNGEQNVVSPTRQKSCFRGFQQRRSVDDHEIIGVAQLSEQRRNLGVGENPKPMSPKRCGGQVVNSGLMDMFDRVCKWTAIRQYTE